MRALALTLLTVVLIATVPTLADRGDADREEPRDNLIETLRLDDDGNPLRGDLRLSAAAAATVTVQGPDEQIRIRALEPADTIPLLGLAPDTTYEITVAADGREETGELTTGRLPDFFPPMEVLAGGGPELTLLDVRFWGGPDGAAAEGEGFVIAVDRVGTPRWYLRTPLTQEDVQRTEEGTILFTYDEGAIREYAVTGELLHEWAGRIPRETVTEDPHGDPKASPDATPVATDQMHHAVSKLPNGNFLTLSREVREIDGFPDPLCGEEDFDGTYRIGSDTVVEIDPETGEVVHSWPLLDHGSPLDGLDTIEPVHFCGPYLNQRYPELAPVRDWSHANAATFDPERDLVLVSLRHLNQVWAFRYPSGELAWRLGEGGDFTLTAGDWFYYQHAPEVQPDGSVLIYDNGNHRPGTSVDGPRLPYSRAVRYEIDLDAMTATQVWEHRIESSDSDPLYAPFLGDADRVGDGTVLINHGGAVEPHSHEPIAEGIHQYARVLEVDPSDTEVVWDLMIRDEQVGWSVYRAERVDTLYPPGFEVEVSVG